LIWERLKTIETNVIAYRLDFEDDDKSH
jgi:hypothetical protein